MTENEPQIPELSLFPLRKSLAEAVLVNFDQEAKTGKEGFNFVFIERIRIEEDKNSELREFIELESKKHNEFIRDYKEGAFLMYKLLKEQTLKFGHAMPKVSHDLVSAYRIDQFNDFQKGKKYNGLVQDRFEALKEEDIAAYYFIDSISKYRMAKNDVRAGALLVYTLIKRSEENRLLEKTFYGQNTNGEIPAAEKLD